MSYLQRVITILQIIVVGSRYGSNVILLVSVPTVRSGPTTEMERLGITAVDISPLISRKDPPDNILDLIYYRSVPLN